MPTHRVHAIFHRQVPGDESLLHLARDRFRAAGLGPEFYPDTPDTLRREQALFDPSEPDPSVTSTVHLPRNLDLIDAASHDGIVSFARAASPGTRGLVVHDQPEATARRDESLTQVRTLNDRLETQAPGPLLFLEYACGLELPEYVRLIADLKDCGRVSACIDISHMAIHECRRLYAVSRPGEDACGLKPNASGLAERLPDLDAACRSAVLPVLSAIAAVSSLGKPIHFHLHDGHPSSTASAYGVCDHLSFFDQVAIPIPFQGATALPLIFGPLGLLQVVATACRSRSAHDLSFTLEIHPPAGRIPLGAFAPLFEHWADRTTAERMNHWIDVLLRNQTLLRECCRLGSLGTEHEVPPTA